jgi:hypothetical protein
MTLATSLLYGDQQAMLRRGEYTRKVHFFELYKIKNIPHSSFEAQMVVPSRIPFFRDVTLCHWEIPDM